MTGHETERWYGVDEAAAACGVSDDSIRRRLHNGRLPNATMVEGRWQIPLTDLVVAGLRPRVDAAPVLPAAPGAPARSLQAELMDLREQLARALARAVAAEALAAARAEHINDLRHSILRGGQMALFGESAR